MTYCIILERSLICAIRVENEIQVDNLSKTLLQFMDGCPETSWPRHLNKYKLSRTHLPIHSLYTSLLRRLMLKKLMRMTMVACTSLINLEGCEDRCMRPSKKCNCNCKQEELNRKLTNIMTKVKLFSFHLLNTHGCRTDADQLQFSRDDKKGCTLVIKYILLGWWWTMGWVKILRYLFVLMDIFYWGTP